MYTFIDVNKASESDVLPSEALKINGEYIENQITGYRTLNVSGREALSPELDYYETGVRDGSKLKSKRYPARTIVITYQLIAESSEAFREAYNKLGAILDVEEAQLIFNDEPDKYYIGTPSAINAIEPGRNSVVGEIEIFCADPFKYSVIEYEATPFVDDYSSVLIDYKGTYKAFPVLEADFFNEDEAGDDGESEVTLTGKGDCGYIAFFDENKRIIQIGDPYEEDGVNAYPKSQTLINQTFLTNLSWGTTAKKLWAVNAGKSLTNDTVEAGTVAMNVASYAVPSNPASTSATILNRKQSNGGAPLFYYTVSAKTSGRTANSVKVDVTITTALARDASYFGHGYGLNGSLFMGGSWHTVTLKTTKEWWEGRTGHVANMSFTVSGLSNTTSALTGIKFKAVRSDSVGGAAGILSETACSNLPISTYEESVPETYYLSASSYGTASDKWHGPSITRSIGADASGEVGAKNFTFTYKQKISIGNGKKDSNQTGVFQMQLLSADNVVVAGVRIHKNKAGTSANCVYYINDAKAYTRSIDLSYQNKYLGTKEANIEPSIIIKQDNKITFSIAGHKLTFKNDAMKDIKVTKVTFAFDQYSSLPALSYNGLYWAKFVKNNCETWKDIPNKFSANDVLEADCKNGEIYLNGILSPELGALGNDWEKFYLTPGLNQIGFSYSDWIEKAYAPNIKIRYREVFL